MQIKKKRICVTVVRITGPKLSVIWVPHLFITRWNLQQNKTINNTMKREAAIVLTGNYTKSRSHKGEMAA
jgi:hypothetical protein